jgi:uncharacterized membrane protein
MTARHSAAERLVDAYLHDLERALAHLEVDERRDVVDSVREHIGAALSERGDPPTAGAIEDILRQLGPVEHIAQNAHDGSPAQRDDTQTQQGANDRRQRAVAHYLLAALIVGMAVTGSLVIMRIPPFFGSEGGDPVAVAQLAWVFIVFAVAARIVRPKSSE